jgi:hypothetical protein
VTPDTARLALVPLSGDEARAQLAGVPDCLAWAEGFPGAGDLVAASRIVSGEWPTATAEVPWGVWVILERGTDLAIGGIGFKSVPDVTGSVEIGYGLTPAFWGRGLATEAVTAITSTGHRHGARVVRAITDDVNIASRRVLEKCGYTQVQQDGEEIHWAHVVTPYSRRTSVSPAP